MASNTIIARFTKGGCGYDPTTDHTMRRGTNVIHHRVFWDVPREWANEIAKSTGSKLVICE